MSLLMSQGVKGREHQRAIQELPEIYEEYNLNGSGEKLMVTRKDHGARLPYIPAQNRPDPPYFTSLSTTNLRRVRLEPTIIITYLIILLGGQMISRP